MSALKLWMSMDHRATMLVNTEDSCRPGAVYRDDLLSPNTAERGPRDGPECARSPLEAGFICRA